MEENKDLIETNNNNDGVVDNTNGTVNLKKNRAGKALSILSLFFGIPGLIVSSVTLAMSVDIQKNLGSGDAAGALGGAFGLILQLIISFLVLGLSVVSLGLGIASIPTSKTRPAKGTAIIATIIATAATIVVVIAFIISFVFKG